MPVPVTGELVPTVLVPGEVVLAPGEVVLVPGEVVLVPGEVVLAPVDDVLDAGEVLVLVPGEVVLVPGEVVLLLLWPSVLLCSALEMEKGLGPHRSFETH